MDKIFVVQSRVNYLVCESETCFAVVGIADNKKRAKEMLKEEVAKFFENMNEMYCDDEGKENWCVDHPLDINNKEDFSDDEYYYFNDESLDVFCEVNILEKEMNA